MSDPLFDHVVSLAHDLSPDERLRLIAELASGLADEKGRGEVSVKPLPSVRGLLKGLGPSPSGQDFDDARRAMIEDMTREEIAR